VALQANRDPRALATKLRHDTGSTLVTWGIVEPHPERPVTLLLRIEGRQMPALKKRCERMLRTHRPLPYARLALWADGKEVDDIPDPELEAGESRTPIGLLGLPAEAGANSPQARAFADAARRGMPFCEECARKRAAS
jgi:hypothetical protein